MPASPQHPAPLSPHDVALGRLAIAWGWVSQATAAELSRRGGSLGQQLVAAGALRADQLLALESALKQQEQQGRGGTTAYSPPPDANLGATVYAPPPGPEAEHDPSAQTLYRPPPPANSPSPVAETLHVPAPGSTGGRLFESSASALPLLGETVEGGYRVETLLGQGGMGAVFRASDDSGKPVALKFILPTKDPGGSMLVRFQREAEAMARIGKVPGIVPVHRAGTHNGCAYLAMGLIEGGDLKQRVREQGPLPAEEAIEIMAQVAESIQGCHDHDVLHRDLKPANILLRSEDGQPFVTDFGLALIAGEAAPVDRLTKTGELMGTPAFMPPEQADGDKTLIGPRTDVYSLGALVFYLVCGRAPFEGGSLQILQQLYLKQPPSLAAARGRPVPPDLEVIVAKAMAKDPAARYASAGELANDLRRLRRGEPVEARAPSRAERFRWRLKQRDPRALGAVLGLGTTVIAVGVALLLLIAPFLITDDRETLAAWIATLPPAIERCVAPEGARLIDLEGMRDLAQNTLSAAARVSREPPQDVKNPLVRRVIDLRERMSADPELTSSSLACLDPTLDYLTLFQLTLELEAEAWDERPQTRRGTPEDRGQALACALTQLGYGIVRSSARAEQPSDEPLTAETLQRLRALRPAAISALERLAAGSDRWAIAAQRALEQIAEVEATVAAALHTQFGERPEEDPVALVPPSVERAWRPLARVSRHQLAASALSAQLDELLVGDFNHLLDESSRMWRVHEVLHADPLLPPDSAQIDAASARIVAFTNQRVEAGIRELDAETIRPVADFAKAYSQSWGGAERAAWALVQEVRAWLGKQRIEGKPITPDMLLISIRLGFGYGKMLRGAAVNFLPEFDKLQSHEWSGDLFFLRGMLRGLLRKGDEALQPRIEVCQDFAAALGEHLTPAERTLLRVEPAVTFKTPLSKIWVQDAKARLNYHATRTAFTLYRRAEQIGDTEEAHLHFARAIAILNRSVAHLIAYPDDARDPAERLSNVARTIRDMLHFVLRLPEHHGLRAHYLVSALQLSDGANAITERILKRLETNASQGGIGVTEELWSSVSSRQAFTRTLSHYAEDECAFFNECGYPEEGLRRLKRHYTNVHAAFPERFPYVLASLLWRQAKRQRRNDLATEIAQTTLAAKLPSDENQIHEAKQLRDSFRATFAVGAVQAGNLDRARELLNTSIEEGYALKEVWTEEFLKQLGTSRAEVKARVAGDK